VTPRACAPGPPPSAGAFGGAVLLLLAWRPFPAGNDDHGDGDD
jgi:hypothetical protein